MSKSLMETHLEELPRNILPNRRLGIYFASKISHANVAKDLMTAWPEFDWTMRWPIVHVGTVPNHAVYAKLFWEHDLEDVAKSDVVLVYSEPKDLLRGALVEAGMGIALGKAIIVVGENASYGTWQYHPNVHRADNLPMARAILRVMAL